MYALRDLTGHCYVHFAFVFILIGTIPSCIDKLNAIASGTLISSTISFNSRGDIPSASGDLLSFSPLMFASIIPTELPLTVQDMFYLPL